jgi:hypothetical protein
MTLHLHHVPLTTEQLASETLGYSVRIERADPASGRFDFIEIRDYGVLEELLEHLDDMMRERSWIT